MLRDILTKSNLHQSSDVIIKVITKVILSELETWKWNEITEDMLLDYYTFLSKHGIKAKGKEGII